MLIGKTANSLVGPEIDRHWVTCAFMWPRGKMPDPMGGKRLIDYDCKVFYKKMNYLFLVKFVNQMTFVQVLKKVNLIDKLFG